MKKFIVFLMIIIIVLSPIKVTRATESVIIAEEALTLLEEGIDMLSYAGSIPFEYMAALAFNTDASNKSYQYVLENYLGKADVFEVNGSQVITRPLTNQEISSLGDFTVYDEDGNEVTINELYYGEVDNGYFIEHIYLKNDGSPVYLDQAKQTPALDVKFGGSSVSYLEWQNAYNSISEQLSQDGYNFGINGANVSDKSYYVFFAPYNGAWAYSLFIANQYEVGVTVPKTSGNNVTINEWYTNAPETFFYTGPTDGNYNLSITSGNYQKDGYNYSYSVYWPTNYNLGRFPSVNNTYSDFLNGSKYNDPNVFSKIGVMYNSSRVSTDVLSFKKVVASGDTIDLSKAYSYDSLDTYIDQVGAISPSPDASYSPSNAISDINYPLVFDVVSDVAETDIPFPGALVVDDAPAIDYPLEDTIDPTLITDNIPIISDLKNKFPFSIPWDIASIISGLEAERVTPYINTDVTIPGVNYTWHIEYDLSDFDDTAALFRTLFLIAFILGLAYFSYDHFFGS